HCGYGEDMPDICPECGFTGLRRWGMGTERLEKEVRARFPEAPVFRLDADTASGYGSSPRLLQEFERSRGGILLGTQMVAKGHHFPDVTLSAVINADLALQFPEFRAEEQTFSLLLQLAGRSGRADKPGKVLIQTWNADIECIKMAADLAVDEFYEAELDRRRQLGYPPYANLINIICQSREGGRARKAVEFLKEKLEPALAGEQVLGPADLFRLQGWSRSHILIKSSDTEKTLKAFRPVLEGLRGKFSRKGVRLIVDVDPQWLS
ncbi:MAG: primosomal protein N', partial [Actinomycetota bacterium]